MDIVQVKAHSGIIMQRAGPFEMSAADVALCAPDCRGNLRVRHVLEFSHEKAKYMGARVQCCKSPFVMWSAWAATNGGRQGLRDYLPLGYNLRASSSQNIRWSMFDSYSTNWDCNSELTEKRKHGKRLWTNGMDPEDTFET